MEILTVILLTPLLFGLPGFLLLEALAIRGIGRGARAVLSVTASLVIVPLYFVILSNFIPMRPNFYTVLPLLLLLGAGAVLRRKSIGRIAIRSRITEPIGKKEIGLGWFWVIGFSLLINLPRLDFFAGGSLAAWGISGDEYWHLCELVSVAGSGLPPRHYFFPDLALVYYYWSWIYPALLSNLHPQWFAPARSLVMQAWMQTFAFVGLAWLLLRWNVRSSWGRVFGLWAITIAGGFDYFASRSLVKYEDWQLRVPWLASTNQVSSFPNMYMWVPQHIAGGMAFLLGILLWRNVRAPGWVRGILLGVVAAFCLGTSAFVFLSAALAFALWLILYRRAWRTRGLWQSLACAAPVFLLAGWYTLLQSIGRRDSLLWNSFRVPVFEGFLRTPAQPVVWLDQVATWIGFPVVAFWVLLVELGIPFLLYWIWSFRHGYGSGSRWKAFLALFPPAFIFSTFLITDSDPGRNFITRGMIPAEIVILLGSAEAMAWIFSTRLRGLRRAAILYVLGTAIVAQMLTPLADVRDRMLQSIGVLFDARAPVEVMHFTVGNAVPPFPAKLAYISWINQETPIDALIVEYGPLEDTTTFRLLQRTRYLAPTAADQMNHLQTDLDLLRLDSYEAWRAAIGDQDPLKAAMDSSYVRDHHPPIFTVLRDPGQTSPGELVYQDAYARVYRVSASENGD
jgi:hypothetical protein